MMSSAAAAAVKCCSHMSILRIRIVTERIALAVSICSDTCRLECLPVFRVCCVVQDRVLVPFSCSYARLCTVDGDG
jgi:hypothetical protein